MIDHLYDSQKISTLKDAHVLIPQIYEHVTWCGKSNSADVTKLMIVKWKIILDYTDGSNLSHESLQMEEGSHS